MREESLHLLVIWPGAFVYSENISKELNQIGANILCSYNVYPSTEALLQFLTEIYSNNLFNKDRIENKKREIVSISSRNEMTIFLCSIEHGEKVWDSRRNKDAFPKILMLKESMRRKIEATGLFNSMYETFHMTDDVD